jgi:hypothetical protein
VALDTRAFVAGLCADLEAAQAGGALRPVALVAEAEAHPLDAERAVPLGLVLNEAVTNALKYAFPGERAGTVRVRFAREGAEFALTVADDGVGLPPGEAGVDGQPPSDQPPHGTPARACCGRWRRNCAAPSRAAPARAAPARSPSCASRLWRRAAEGKRTVGGVVPRFEIWGA